MITSDAGGLLLRQVNETFSVIGQFAACFRDHRDPELIEHPVEQLLAQRLMGIALGYEDLNDHDELRHDPLMALLSGRDDLTGRKRRRERDRGKALAGRNTLNRLELAPVGANASGRYKKIVACQGDIDRFFVDIFCRCTPSRPKRSTSTSTPLTIHCMLSSWAVSSTDTTKAIAICGCTFSAARSCCA